MTASGRIRSPCNDVCQLDRGTGWCLGCGRTGAEIAAWPGMTDEVRDMVMALLPPRLEALGLPADPARRREEGERRAREQRMRPD
jgi:predicted Fe-S protein YdhL (DUF1289 family)